MKHVIRCLTCGETWPHGEHPDLGGTAAHEHHMQFAASAKPHIIVVQDAEQKDPKVVAPLSWWKKLLGTGENGGY